MSRNDGLYVGIKLLGIYCLGIGVKDIFSVLGAIGLTVGGETNDPTGSLTFFLASTVTVFVLGLLLTFKTSGFLSLLSSENDAALPACSLDMGGALKLLGVF